MNDSDLPYSSHSFFRPFRPLLRGWLLSVVGWGLIAIVVSGEMIARTSLSWIDAIRPSLRDWLPWAVLTPLLFRLVSRLPLDRSHWRRAVPIHFFVAVLVLGGVQTWKRLGPHPGPFGPGGPHSAGHREGPPPGPPPDGDHRGGADHRPPSAWRAFDMLHFASVDLPIYLVIVSAAHALFFYRQAQERAASLSRARLAALRMQLQPHFLFNTLNTIAGLVHDEPDKADALLTVLSDLLRQTLDTNGANEQSLARELEFIELYLSILRARFEERMACSFDVAADTREASVPVFILQPLVENAVQHGISPLPAGGCITIRAWRKGPTLHLAVTDNGFGLQRGPEPRRAGIGLANTRARLRETYGDAATLVVRENNGVTVELRLPFRTVP